MSTSSLTLGEAFLPLLEPDGAQYEHYALYGGRGGGKSHAAAFACVYLSSKKEERIVGARQFQNSIRDSSKELIEATIRNLGLQSQFTSTDREIINTVTGSRFSFIGMDRNPQSMKSLEGASLVWVEEADACSQRAIEILIPTVRAPNSRFIWTWNPRFRTDPVDAMFRSTITPEASYIRQVSWRDNPYFFQTRMPSEMRRSLRVNPLRHGHIWEGGYDEAPEAAVFQWSIGRVDVPDKARPRFGLDFGFGSDPNFLVKVYFLPEIDTIYIAQEAMGHRVSNRNLPALMDTVTEVRDYFVTADSSRPETIDYLGSEGFSVYGSKKGKGSVKNGINFIQGYNLVVAPECVNIQDELRAYHWAVDKQNKPLPFPAENQQDHGIDALRYALEDDATSPQQGDDVSYV